MFDPQVIDMDVVVDVIGQLESFQISREELEVNHHLVLSHRFQRKMKKACNIFLNLPKQHLDSKIDNFFTAGNAPGQAYQRAPKKS